MLTRLALESEVSGVDKGTHLEVLKMDMARMETIVLGDRDKV